MPSVLRHGIVKSKNLRSWFRWSVILDAAAELAPFQFMILWVCAKKKNNKNKLATITNNTDDAADVASHPFSLPIYQCGHDLVWDAEGKGRNTF